MTQQQVEQMRTENPDALAECTGTAKGEIADRGWQPIETAPLDKTKVFIWRADWTAAPIAYWDWIEGPDEYGEGGFCLWVVEDEHSTNHDGIIWPEDDGEPTHWAPLP